MENDMEKRIISIIEDMTEDWGVEPDGGITGSTLLVRDLEFASVDIIQLCVAIEQRFERKFGFQDMLMQDGSYVSDLSVSDIVSFISSRMETGHE